MRMNVRLDLLCAVVMTVVFVAAPVVAQPAKEKTPDQPPPTAPGGAPAAAAPAANRPAAAEYQKVFEDWKTVLKDLRKLKLQFQTAALADQAKIQLEWDGLIGKGNETVAALEAAGLKAYAEAPNEDPQLT